MSNIIIPQQTYNDLATEAINTIKYFVMNVSIEELKEAKEDMMKNIESAEVENKNILINYFNRFWKTCFEIYEEFNNVSII